MSVHESHEPGKPKGRTYDIRVEHHQIALCAPGNRVIAGPHEAEVLLLPLIDDFSLAAAAMSIDPAAKLPGRRQVARVVNKLEMKGQPGMPPKRIKATPALSKGVVNR
jgi:hypothetical protein